MCDCFLASPSALAGVGGATTGWLIDTARDAAAVAPVRLGDQEIWMFIDEYDDRDSPYFVLDTKKAIARLAVMKPTEVIRGYIEAWNGRDADAPSGSCP